MIPWPLDSVGWLGAAAAALLVGLLLGLLIGLGRARRGLAQQQAIWADHTAAHAAQQQALLQALAEQERRTQAAGAAQARDSRAELSQALAQQQSVLLAQVAEGGRTQNAQIDALAQQIAVLQKHVGDTLHTQLQAVNESTLRRLQEVRETLDLQLRELQRGNAAKLDEMRQIVDEKLQATLQQRLGDSFNQVAQRLEQVHQGLGEMQALAQGVGDLKHLLSNVKSRGLFGEAQLQGLLEQVFTPEQYAVQVATRPGSRQVVDFAIKLPGREPGLAPVWLPIDAKFPTEDYERLLQAQQQADPVAVQAAQKALEQTVRQQAKSIAEKYLEPPHTTDFAILFLPTESLYAEVLRLPGLMERLQREQRVSLAGPTSLLSLLNALHMGFRTLALERRSSEVWRVLGAVKTEFDKFGDLLARVRSQTQTVLNTLEQAQTRTRVMHKALREVESVPRAQAEGLLPPDEAASGPQ